jgi:hypothetical protein
MFTDTQNNLALDFAKKLVNRNYSAAHDLLSHERKLSCAITDLQSMFEAMISLDWGEVNPLELHTDPLFAEMFIYVVLGGDGYSEAIFIYSFTTENKQDKINVFEFGRP